MKTMTIKAYDWKTTAKILEKAYNIDKGASYYGDRCVNGSILSARARSTGDGHWLIDVSTYQPGNFALKTIFADFI